jgi:hypothetical protein
MFWREVVAVFGPDYLRASNADDTARVLEQNAARGFSRMLESIDCMLWGWKSFPFSQKVTYKGHNGASYLRQWLIVTSGMAGTHNNINVLHHSPMFAKLAEADAPTVNFKINGHTYNKGYYLDDGIYPHYATFVKTISHPAMEKDACQEACHKDVDLAFSMLH